MCVNVNKKRDFQNSKEWLYFSVLASLGFFIRFLWILTVQNPPISDFAVYQKLAESIFQNQGYSYLGYPTALRPPLYPIVLGYTYKLFGNTNIFYGKLLNVFLSLFISLLIFLIFKKIIKNKRLFWASFIFCVFLPNYIAYCNTLGTEILSLFLLTLIIFLQIYLKSNWLKYLTIGGLVGALSLTKTFFILYPVVITLTEWLNNKNIQKALKNLVLLTLGVLFVITPWTYRNYQKFNKIIPISWNSGIALFVNNNNENTHGGWMPISAVKTDEQFKTKLAQYGFQYNQNLESELDAILINPNLEALFREKALSWIIHHPFQFTLLGLLRIKNTFFLGASDIISWTMDSYYINLNPQFTRLFNVFRSLTDIIVYNINVFALAFLILNLKNLWRAIFTCKNLDFKITLPLLNLLFLIFIVFIFEGQPRYAFPFLWLNIVACAYIINEIREEK